MGKKLTQEEVRIKLEERGYVLIGEYVNYKTKITLKDKEGYLYTVTWRDFIKLKSPYRFGKSNLYTIHNIKLWMKINNIKNYELISKQYNGYNEPLYFKCLTCNEIFDTTWGMFSNGNRCPYCSNHRIKLGVNTIWDTDRWMCDLGVSEEDAKKYSKSSKQEVLVTCPHCNRKKYISLNTIHTYKSIQCSCGDGTSYSEKIMMCILEQLNIKYTKEYSPEWSGKKRYDFYIPDYNCIIECHGKQHYNCDFSYCGCRTLQDEQSNDNFKKELALNNNIKHYIIIDCSVSTIEQIKNNILNSKLNDMFDLSNIDWLKCESEALSNKIKEVCNYWYLHNEINNEKMNTKDVSVVFNISRTTVTRYLKRGNKMGWCNYNPKEEMKKNGSNNGKKSTSKPIEVFKDGKSFGIFESCAELERQSKELFGVKFIRETVSEVCRGKRKFYKGYTFKYIKE